jgi:hypothetical protein
MKHLSTGNMIGIRNIEQPRQTKRPGVNKVLRSAYQLYFRDKLTRLAVRRCLG